MPTTGAKAGAPRLLTVVAVALIDADGRVLLQQRPAHKEHGGLWEFPGGKLHEGELPEAALIRELKEELGIVVWVRKERLRDYPMPAADVPLIPILQDWL